MTTLSADDIFNIHPMIRWVGLASEAGEVVFVKQRSGVRSFSPEETDRAFVQMGPLIVTGVCERLSNWTGNVGSIIINYEKVTSLIMRTKDGYLALTLDKSAPSGTVEQIIEAIRKLG